jgi:hypothetical protein
VSYCTAAQVRLLYEAITVEAISDADILLTSEAFADPVIDGALRGRGAPFTAGSVPALVQSISALLTAAVVFDNKFYQTAQESGVSQALRKQAKDLLDDIRKGGLDPGGVSAPALMLTSDPALDRPETEVFTGDELTWESRNESRE